MLALRSTRRRFTPCAKKNSQSAGHLRSRSSSALNFCLKLAPTVEGFSSGSKLGTIYLKRLMNRSARTWNRKLLLSISGDSGQKLSARKAKLLVSTRGGPILWTYLLLTRMRTNFASIFCIINLGKLEKGISLSPFIRTKALLTKYNKRPMVR